MSHNVSYHIAEMCCADEVRQLKDVLLPLVRDEENLFFDLMRTKLTIQAPDEVEESQLRDAIRTTGMHADPWVEGGVVEEGGWWKQHGRTILTLLGTALVLVGFLLHALSSGVVNALTAEGFTPLSAILLYSAAAIAGGWYILPKAWISLRRFSPDMNLLMTLAVIGAMLLGAWLEAASVAVLFAFSLLLESWSVSRARRAVEALLNLAPDTALLLTPGGESVELPVGDILPGQRVRVRPGDRVPLDGEIVHGSTSLNQAPITGESMPVDAGVGDQAYAGSINGEGVIDLRVSHPADRTTLARIIRLVEEARSKRAASEKWVDRFARVYTPAMFGLAAMVALVGPLLGGGEWATWAYRALVVLVIACPCALVISTPVAVVAGMTAASRRGLLIKGGVFLEAPARLKAIAFDKTGTLTHGEPEVVAFQSLSGESEESLLNVAVALEKDSTHPLAQAIVAFGKEKSRTTTTASYIRNHTGLGIEGEVLGASWRIGREHFLQQVGVDLESVQGEIEALEQEGATVVLLARDATPLAIFGLRDSLREEAKPAIAALKQTGIEHLVMLTGDRETVARNLAASIGIEEVEADLMPEQKVDAIQKLVDRYQHVAMVGDGVNDAPALATASFGIAMGASATDAALETADIALLGDDLNRLPWLIHHSRRSLGIIRANIGFAIGIKALFLVLAAFNLATLWMAIAADMGASLAVTFNALRLLHTRD
ncbi:heavy metal translocating P-type ATPase [bacterium]|nr:heavy metal translocating P-type ATPase [bacterium]